MAGGKDGFSMLVDSGASAHFVVGDLIPDLCDSLESYQELKAPMIITAASMRRVYGTTCLLYTSPSPRDATLSRMPSSA